MAIRVATEADITDIVRMGVEFLRESAYRTALVENAPRMEALAQQLITSPDGEFLLAESPMEQVVGMFGLVAYDHHISGQRIAGEVVYWVDPTVRGQGQGLQLLGAAEAWAKDHGAVIMQMISPTPQVDTLYERLGYASVERLFQKAL